MDKLKVEMGAKVDQIYSFAPPGFSLINSKKTKAVKVWNFSHSLLSCPRIQANISEYLPFPGFRLSVHYVATLYVELEIPLF